MLIKTIQDQQIAFNDLAARLQQLTQEVLIARTHFGFFKWLSMGKHTKQVDEHPAFEYLTRMAHLRQSLLGLTKVADPSADRKTLSLGRFLVQLEAFLTSPVFDQVEGLDSGRGAERQGLMENASQHLPEIPQDRAFLQQLPARFTPVWNFRNRSIAHLDKKHVTDPEGLLNETGIVPNQVDKLVADLDQMLIKYTQILHGGATRRLVISALNAPVAFLCHRELTEWERKWKLPGSEDEANDETEETQKTNLMFEG